MFQCVYSNLFLEIYCSTERSGFDLKINFQIIFKTYKDKKNFESSFGKILHHYEGIRNETNVYEQNPIKKKSRNALKKKRKEKEENLLKITNFLRKEKTRRK